MELRKGEEAFQNNYVARSREAQFPRDPETISRTVTVHNSGYIHRVTPLDRALSVRRSGPVT